MQNSHQHPAQSNNPIQPFLVFGTPRVSWEQTQTALIGMGVPHTQLQQWHSLYLWDELHQALQGGWDPRQEIEKHLTPFFEYLGDRRYRCIAPMRDGRPGEVCGWEGAKRDRTNSHLCGHLGYNAWVCDGQCDRIGCTQRFAEKRNLDQHTKPDPVPCPNCGKVIKYTRNLKEHMDSCK